MVAITLKDVGDSSFEIRPNVPFSQSRHLKCGKNGNEHGIVLTLSFIFKVIQFIIDTLVNI